MPRRPHRPGSRRARSRGRLALVAVVLAALVAGCGGGGTASCDEDLPGVRQGVCPLPIADRRAAPDAALPVLGDQDRELSLSQHRGDVVVVNFWASWCGPCRREQPELNTVHDRYANQEVSFVGVDVQESSELNGLRHEEEFAIPYPSMWDPDTSFAGRFDNVGPQTLPATVLVDRAGRVAVSLIGETNAVELSELIDRLLEEPGPT